MKYILKPTYHPFYQLPYCCVPATLQWILYRHGLDIMNQEDIGSELGLRLPLKGRNFFTNLEIKYMTKEPHGGFGTQIEKDKYSIQNFFNRYKIPLKISDLSIIEEKESLKEFLTDNISKGNDIILRYNNKLLKRDDQKSCGHFSLIASFDDKLEIVTVGDPDLPHFKQASIEDILFSVSDKIDGIQRGFYLVSKSD